MSSLKIKWIKLDNIGWMSKKWKNIIDLIVTVPSMGHFEISSVLSFGTVFLESWKLTSSSHLQEWSFFSLYLQKRTKGEERLQRANDLGRFRVKKNDHQLSSDSGRYHRYGLYYWFLREIYFTKSLFIPHNPTCAICVTFTAFGSANSARSMKTPRSQEHWGWRLSCLWYRSA